MLYEVITENGSIVAFPKAGRSIAGDVLVITSYSIHYTKLYDYILYREEHKQARNQRLRPDASSIQDYMLVSRYARFQPELGRRETFAEAVGRVRDMHLGRYPGAEQDIRWAFDQVVDKRCLPSMRSMQFGGSAIESNHARMYNCTFGICDRIEFFREGLFLLLCGTGVGRNNFV